MVKAIIYGTGDFYGRYKHLLPKDIEIIAYADSSCSRATSISGELFEGKKILMPAELESTEYDVLYICTDIALSHIIYGILKRFHIDFTKIRFLNRIVYGQDNWEYKVLEDKTILSTIGNLAIYEKKRTDMDIFWEIFLFHEYSINLLPHSIVIDIGMNVGFASLYFASYDEVDKVYGFEPFPDTYQMALDNFKLNTYEIQEKIIPHNVAVTDKDEYMDVAVKTNEPGWRSILSQDKNSPKIRIQCKSAAAVVEEIIKDNPNKKYVLKCDTEGSEYMIFDSLAQANLLSKFDSIVMEYHEGFESIIKLLETNGYRYYQRERIKGVGIIAAFRTER